MCSRIKSVMMSRMDRIGMEDGIEVEEDRDRNEDEDRDRDEVDIHNDNDNDSCIGWI